MPIMVWDDSLDVGVAGMNAEHRDILNAMNAIYDSHKAGMAGEGINRLVAKLGEVTTRHFADEERYMEKIRFPGVSSHKLIHAKLLADFGKHAAAIRDDGGRANDAFFQFLSYWLSAHIRGIDVKYGAHARAAVTAA